MSCILDIILEKYYEINGEVNNMRYIRLTKKRNIEDTFSPYVQCIFNIKQLHIDSSSILCSHNYIDFKSKNMLFLPFNMIPYIFLLLLYKINLEPIDSYNGYSIVYK